MTTIFCLSKINQNQHLEFKIASKLHQKNTSKQRRFFCPSKLGRTKRQSASKQRRFIELRLIKYVETTSFLHPWKLRWTKYVEMISVFRTLKLRRRKYVETTSIFHPSKLHRKNTSKWHGNSLIFSLRCIGVILPSNRRRFEMVCTLVINCLLPFQKKFLFSTIEWVESVICRTHFWHAQKLR